MSLPGSGRGRAAAGLVTLAVAVGVASPAAAAPGGSVQQRAQALHAQLDRLQVQAESATERYDAAQEALGAAVTRHLSMQARLDDLRSAAGARHQLVDARARGLYMSGGQAGLLATLVAGEDPTDLVTRLHEVQGLVSVDRARARAADTALARTGALEHSLAGVVARQQRLQRQAADAADRVHQLLAEQQQLVATADTAVVRLAAAQQAAAQAAAAQAFAERLAAAQAAPTGGVPLPPGTAAAAAVAAARTRLGDPYVWGATGPHAFDCSGLTQWAYAQAGVHLPRVAADQWNSGPHPDLAQLAPGDLLFWATDPADWRTIHHVAIYLGGGMMIAAPHTGDVVKIQPVYGTGFFGATRPGASTPGPTVSP